MSKINQINQLTFSQLIEINQLILINCVD